MILSQLSVVFSFLGAAKCMNVGSRDLFIGVGGVAQKEFGNLVETSHLPVINEQSSDFNKEIIPEYSHDFSAKYIYPGPTSFHSQIAQEISTLESNGEQFGELISSSTNHPRYFGEVDDSIFKAHENLVDYPKFQDFIYGDNNLMEAEDQIFPSEFMKPDEYDSLARFKKQRLNDVFPVNSSEKIPHLTNTVNQGNEGSFVSHVNLHEGSTPFFNAHPYPQLDHRLNTISRQALLAQNSLNHDFLNPDATHSAGQNPILPSAHGEYHNSDYIPFSGSDYWSQIFQSTFPNSDNTFDHLLNSQNHHNSYSNTENLPFEQTEIYENTYNRQLENSLDTLIQNNSLGHKNSIMAGNLVINHSSNYRPNMLKKEVHISGSGKESMTENQIIDNSNKQYVTPDKPSKNHKISIVNSVRSEGGSINEFKRNHIPDETTPFVLSTLELQKNNNEIINQLDQTNNAGSSLQTYTESSEANKKSILENLAEVGGFKNFEDNKFTLDSQTDLNNFMELFEKNPKLAPLFERSITIDTYIDSIFEKLDLENSRIRKIFKIIQAHKKIQTKSAREMVSRNFSFFCNLIACPYIMNSQKSFISLKNKDSLNSLDQDFIVTKSLRVANFMNDCALVDFFESYKYPLKSYHWN
ncbi:hypothetical protein BY996DRAFT_8686531 [Phakopsora pachyrhizi]|nr:hypothetical protein BY996DRAFT_8686531 [Phakopsora pachyrhizi]